jgi:hypothetical protein
MLSARKKAIGLLLCASGTILGCPPLAGLPLYTGPVSSKEGPPAETKRADNAKARRTSFESRKAKRKEQKDPRQHSFVPGRIPWRSSPAHHRPARVYHTGAQESADKGS